MKKILRLTRHTASEAQKLELNRIYGEVEIVEVSETVTGAARVKELIEENAADVFEAVLPPQILAEVLNPRSGIVVPVIRAAMIRELAADGVTVTFTFSHYERIVKVEVITEKL